MRGIVVDGLFGQLQGCFLADAFPAAGIARKAGMRPARNLEPNALPWLEAVGRRPQLQLDKQHAVFLARRRRTLWRYPDDAIAQVQAAPRPLDDAQPGEEVGVVQARP